MVSDTRSARKINDEAGGHGSKKEVSVRKDSSKCSSGKADISGVRRSARETSSSSRQAQMTRSPQSMRKSKRLDKGMPPLTPPVKRKSERLETYNTPSPMRRSDRGKKNLSSSSSGNRQSAKELSLSESKRKKEKTLIQVTMESKKAELDLEAVGMKRKKMNARAFKSLFKRQRIQEIIPDVDGKLEGPDKLSHVCSDNSRQIGSESMGSGENVSDECSRRVEVKLREENVDKASDGAIQKSICSLKGTDAELFENDINMDSNLDDVVDEPPDGDGSKYSCTSLIVRENLDDSERLPTNYSATKNMDAPESESSTCLARLRDVSVSPESGEYCMHPKEAITSPSAKHEYRSLLGTCVLCSKNIRVGYDSPTQELCSCDPTVDEDLGSFSTCKDRGDRGAAVTPESSEKYDCRLLSGETRANYQMDGDENVCAVCNKDGELLYCAGKGCKRCYHVYCLDPTLSDVLPGFWHCPQCVKKKLLFGVHSVSAGVESIWDVREVDVSNAKGVSQKQYLVKYHGLAHIHNHWVPEKQLLRENPCLVSNFIAKNQIVRWSAEWIVPHRLLRKRSIQDNVYIASSAVISVCNYEWLVKWRGLSYDHATWELDSACFLSSSLGQNLMRDYEIRRGKATQEVDKRHKGSIVKLSELPAIPSLVNDNHVLKIVNKLRECWFKCQNAVVIDNQERAMTVTSFIQSLSETCWPFLIVAASGSLSQWEAEFARLVPSVDVVVYSGNKDTRKGIRASEFYKEGGHIMLQVLLSSPEAVFEDVDILRSIRWEAIVFDEYQHSGISNDLEPLKMLPTDSRILLVSVPIKDTTSEYLKILSMLESDDDFDKLRSLKFEANYNLCKLKDRLSCFIACESTAQVSKFLEYWVPVQLSNYQLEQYCATLLSNSTSLRSCSRSDPVGALRDILLTVRKCCDHPYLLDSSVQERLIAERCSAADLLDIGIKASGKLELLDTMLTEIKNRGLQVLILFQLVSGSGGASTGDILDDFLRQKFGPNTYERVDGGVIPSKKQAAVNRFNKKETGQFVFLLENRACSATIKLLSLDVIVMYDSDWNPANDLRALQKLSIDSKVEQVKVFRLYSSCTVEERALVLAKQSLNLDNNLQTLSRATSDTLLSWGASYLFSKLHEYHADSISTSALNFSSGQLLLNEVTKEFQAILSESCENTLSGSVISNVKLGAGSYSTNIPMLGEAKVQLKDGEEPHVFWRNLLDGRNPRWKHLKGPSPRNRKRVHYLDGSPRKSVTENDDGVKKRKKVVNENGDPALVQVESGASQVTQVAGSKGGPSTIKECNQSQCLQRDSVTCNNNPNCTSGQNSFGTDEQNSLHSVLQGQMMRLCQILKFPEVVTHIVRRFLEYVMKNHHVNSDSPAIVQAFQISLCWVAASISKYKVDKKDSLLLAKQLLNYQCTEEQVNSVYSRMRSLKKMYLQCPENTIDSGRYYLLTEEDISKEPSNVDEGELQYSQFKLKNVKMEIGEKPADEEQVEGQILLQEKVALKDKAAGNEIDEKIKKIQKKCNKRMKKLTWKHQEQIQEFHRIWEEKRLKFETDHKLESAFIRSIHGQGSVRMDKLKLLDDNFAKKMEEHNLLKDLRLKELEAEQLAAMNEEGQKAAQWLAEANASFCELRAVNGPQSLGSQSEDDAGGSQSSTHTTITDRGAKRGNDVTPAITSTSAPAKAIGCDTPIKSSLVTVNPQNEEGVTSLEKSSFAVVQHLNQSKHSSDNAETVSENLSAPVIQISDEIQSVDPNEVVGHVRPVELGNASNKDYDEGNVIALADALVNQRDGPDEAASGVLPFPGQLLVHSEQTVALPDSCDLLQHQVPQDKVHQGLVSTELQDRAAPAVGNQSTLQVEVVTLELGDSVTPVPSNLDIATPVQSNCEAPVTDVIANPVQSNREAPETDDIATPIQSNCEAPVTENSEQLHAVSSDVYLSCNQSPDIEVEHQNHDQGRSSSQTAEPGGIEVLSYESILQTGEDLEPHHVNLDLGPGSGVGHGQSVELSASSLNSMAIPQSMVNTAELPNQAVPQLGIDPGHLHGPSYLLVHPTHQATSWNSTPSLFSDPLQNELERIRKETEQLEKSREDMMSQVKSDCKKEIQEIITQIRNKYEVKLRDTESEFRLKRDELDKNQSKVLMNKILAEAFRSKCLDLRPSGLPGMQQGVPSSFMQHLHQLSQPPLPMRRSPRASACQPAPSQPNTGPAIQTMQHLSRPHPVRSSPVPGQSVAPPPIQTVQHAAALFSGTSSRPPVISAMTPAGNPRVGGEIRSPAPHLQPFRPAAASTVPSAASPSVSQLRPPQMPPSQPVQLPPPPPPGPAPPQAPQPLSTNFVSQNRPESQAGLAATPNPSPSALGLLMNMDHHRPSVPENRTSSSLPAICSTFGSLELSDLEALGSVQGNQTSVVATSVVCLSDDD